ncbi:hypothetical protein GCM10028778_22140 [Barrientosiimonas marina]
MSMVACICEGNAERAVIDLLLDHDCLNFTRSEMLEGEVLKYRSAKSFQKNVLNKTMNEKIRIYRILDSINENFQITGPFEKKSKKL